ncbi:MAG: hypothetical protein KBS54_00725 [Synergistaceae bacterium]|nr:hypothetical protein [Candidatus Equadaptatus faecalis]
MGSWFAEHIVEIVIAIATAYGAYIAFREWKSNSKFRELDSLYNLIDKTRSDKDIADAISLVDWNGCGHEITYDGEFAIDGDRQRGKEFEMKLDAALAIFSHACYLSKIAQFSDDDMKFFEYRIRRIANCTAICDYLYSLYHFSAAQGTTMSFIHLVNYLIDKKYLDKDFKCPKQNRYVYQLNDGAMYQEYLAKHSCEHCK